MKERPILYSTPMVQAKLAGRKTQTRRVVKESKTIYYSNDNKKFLAFADGWGGHELTGEFCPYGKVGDILWGRESFWSYGYWETRCHENGLWDGKSFDWKEHSMQFDKPDNTEHSDYREWRHMPSIFLKKKHARIWERITNIRVERLQDISEEDAFAEGIDTETDETYLAAEHYQLGGSPVRGGCPAICAYAALWESINGPGSWELNPFCWVIETEVLSTTGRPKYL